MHNFIAKNVTRNNGSAAELVWRMEQQQQQQQQQAVAVQLQLRSWHVSRALMLVQLLLQYLQYITHADLLVYFGLTMYSTFLTFSDRNLPTSLKQ